MSSIKSFEDLKVWQKARQLCKEVHQLINQENFSRDFGLKNQLNRFTGSIMDNIAEGFGRAGNPEFISFLNIARGSAFEAKSQFYRALDRGYVSAEKFESLTYMITEIVKMIASLIRHLMTNEHNAFRNKVRDQNRIKSQPPTLNSEL